MHDSISDGKKYSGFTNHLLTCLLFRPQEAFGRNLQNDLRLYMDDVQFLVPVCSNHTFSYRGTMSFFVTKQLSFDSCIASQADYRIKFACAYVARFSPKTPSTTKLRQAECLYTSNRGEEQHVRKRCASRATEIDP